MDRFTPPVLKRVDSGFWDLKLPYIPKYAYLENLAVGASDSAEELETAYRALTMNLALLAPDQSRLRKVSTPLVISPSGDRPTRGTCRRSGTSPSPRTPISPVANPSSPGRGAAARRGHGACGRRRHRPGRFRQDATRDRVRLPVPPTMTSSGGSAVRISTHAPPTLPAWRRRSRFRRLAAWARPRSRPSASGSVRTPAGCSSSMPSKARRRSVHTCRREGSAMS